MPVLCLLSLISRNSLKQLGMVSPELQIKAMLSPWPVERPVDWTDRGVNAPLSAKELARLRVSIERGRPFGEEWVKRTASDLSLGHIDLPHKWVVEKPGCPPLSV